MRRKLSPPLLLLLLPSLLGWICAQPMQETDQASSEGAAEAAVAVGPVRTGAHVLADEGFRRLAGKRVGLVVNHTAMVDTTHLADLVDRAEGVELTALFGPEHGVRGQAAAGELVENGRDPGTGAVIHSLYGQTRKPTPEMMRDVDVLVFDIQDVGTRFYTYISTMGYVMQAAAEKGIPFVVMDRPNPLGGEYVAGWLMEEEHESFVGLYPIPITHGLTVGELAQMIKGEQMLPGLENLDLQVVEMTGWSRPMLWTETGLRWIPPSPNIPTFETALVFPGAGFFEATSQSEGRGTMAPFIEVGATWADGERMAQLLNARNLPGVRFEPATFTPREIPGMANDPKQEGNAVHGVRHVVTDPKGFDPVAVGIHVLQAFYDQVEPSDRDEFLDRPEWLANLSGKTLFAEMLRRNAPPEEIIASWSSDVEAFRRARAPYLLYE